MARIRIFHASVNPQCYADEQLDKLSRMSFDEAVEFFENDEIRACSTGIYTVSDSVPHEDTIHADDRYDTMFNWIKVDCCY